MMVNMFRSAAKCRVKTKIILSQIVVLTLLSFTPNVVKCESAEVHHSRHARSDDVSLASLAVTVQQQSAAIASLQAELAAEKAMTSAVKNDVAAVKGQVTSLSKTVAFTARFSTDDGIDGVAIGNKAPLRFDTVPINIGNGYDPQTGMFTAPVSGTYCFFVVLMGAGNHGIVDLWLRQSDPSHGVLDVIYSRDDGDQGSSLVTSHLGAGERAWVEHALGNAVRGQWYTYFTGFLVHVD